ncbi:MAG: methyl-accepting chemotaxis protein [Planctomycetaceae bacterium]|nr:methyl-accepting chemotaxis protein [Planctomycetaceae bacterium]
MDFSRSMLAKILVPVLSITIVLAAVVALVGFRAFSQFATEIFDKEIHTISQHLERDIDTLKSKASDQVQSLAVDAGMIAAINEGNREQVRNLVVNFESARKCTFFTVLDSEGRVIFRTNRPEQYGDSQVGMRSVDEALSGRRCVYFESTPNSPMSVRAAAPIVDLAGNRIGAVTGGYRLDTSEWVDDVKRYYNVECTVFADDRRVATTLINAETGERIVGTTLDNPEIYDIVFGKREPVFRNANVRGRPMKVWYGPLLNPGDTRVFGMIFIGIPMERQTELVRQQMWQSLSVTIIGLLFSTGILFWIIRGLVTPLITGGAILRGIAERGDIQTNVSKELLERRDEIGSISRNINRVLEDYRSIAKMTEKLADGDWQATVTQKTDEDELNRNIGTMLDGVNDTLRQINSSVEQVSTGAGEVSSVAQNLADGSQKTAASLEQITASMHEISSQTKQNAESASSARDLAQGASQAATEGQSAMRDMVSSMDKITKNSAEIQRVIKVIDDIAFQTNLLALNAAVEAARAGQHGKGFAVVAEEVRNLASRSAKAARETSELIANSGTEIERGGKIANQTSEVLNAIVEKVKQTTDLVAGIAIASNEQAQGVGQVTIGLQQIDQVTQQNTAVAEQSASAANEMSAMARTLRELVAQFRLRH